MSYLKGTLFKLDIVEENEILEKDLVCERLFEIKQTELHT